MSQVKVQGNASGVGIFTITSPNSANTQTLTLPDATATLVGDTTTQTLTNKTLTSPTISSPTINGTPVMGASVITSGTSVASTSGTAIDFTSIPSWVKRITVMFSGVSTNGASDILIQLGAGSVTTTGYASAGSECANNGTPNTAASTAGFLVKMTGASRNLLGTMTICAFGSNAWVESYSSAFSADVRTGSGGGSVTLSGTLDRVRITTVNGTDTFDAGSINIMWE